jgi:DNA-binding NarL/FixJ family response regulator
VVNEPSGLVQTFHWAPSAPSELAVVLVEPLHLVRAGMGLLISSAPDLEVLAGAATAEEALAAVRELAGEAALVVVVGLSLPGRHNAYWLIREIRRLAPGVLIVATGGRADRAAISRALFSGDDGFVDKSAAPDDFLAALRRARQGEVVLEGVPLEWLGSIADALERHRRFIPFLTDRELQVLSAAAEGLTARQMGRRLGIEERTVTTHLGRIYGKLGVNGRTAAVRAATRTGLLTAAGLDE